MKASMNDVTCLLLFRTLTRDSYESGISDISKALNNNEAMVMVSSPHHVQYSLICVIEFTSLHSKG